jgi:hypothetical protein
MWADLPGPISDSMWKERAHQGLKIEEYFNATMGRERKAERSH